MELLILDMKSKGPYKGRVFNGIEVLEEGTVNDKLPMKCHCGREFSAFLNDVKRGATKSCGCMNKGNLVHGLSSHPLYSHYQAMIRRCYDPTYESYHLYGGKGTYVCERWLEPEGQGLRNFIADKHPKPGPEYQLDKDLLAPKEGPKVYSPETTCWLLPDDNRELGNQQRRIPQEEIDLVKSLYIPKKFGAHKIDKLTGISVNRVVAITVDHMP